MRLDFNMKVFLSQMTDFSQLGIRNRGKLILFFKISKFGIRAVSARTSMSPQHYKGDKHMSKCTSL